jgi:hypothetical protein
LPTNAVGKTKKIHVVVYSDGPADKQHAFTFQGFTDSTGQPFFNGDLSPSSGKSGDHLTLTIKTLRADPVYGGDAFILTAENVASDPNPRGSSTIGLVRISP